MYIYGGISPELTYTGSGCKTLKLFMLISLQMVQSLSLSAQQSKSTSISGIKQITLLTLPRFAHVICMLCVVNLPKFIQLGLCYYQKATLLKIKKKATLYNIFNL